MKKKLILFIIFAVLLTQMPVIGKYFSIVNTLIHETGHSLMAIITGGKVQSISLFSNTEGATLASHRFWLGSFLTSAAGYVFSSFTAFLFMVLIYKRRSGYVLSILLAILVISLLFWVRNLFGLFWIITIIAAFSWVLWKGSKTALENLALFFASLLLVESITSSFEIMYLSFVSPMSAGDATNLAKATFIIPTQLWGIIFFLQSLFFARLGLKRYFKSSRTNNK
ncbi:M50 family metallopeptidase [Aquibacillus saliphilus]|uniref:M50 family metallopeptidase n=1 Tax=Aquibacillus saliphilus TaxID=1909422 RepID=UPI001CF01E9D|nr:M50 family metallopeptidase [Aquibacillus saliphilus]